ncbi:MAG: dependent ligase, partial [Thermomicrobiales bacterium]|nr:dependent ligase [Thermomicrobiales bacterium]
AAAQLWMVDHCAAGIEGVVAKRLIQVYRPGGRTWRKVRTRTTAEAVVGGVSARLCSRTR